MERSAVVLGVLTSLRDPSEDSDLISLSSSLLQLASSDGLSTSMKYHYGSVCT